MVPIVSSEGWRGHAAANFKNLNTIEVLLDNCRYLPLMLSSTRYDVIIFAQEPAFC